MYSASKIFISFIISFGLISAQTDSVYIDLENLNLSEGTVEVTYYSPGPIAGAQFNIIGATITGASGGQADIAEWVVSTSESTWIGFSMAGDTLPSGTGIISIVEMEITGDELCLSGPVISDPTGGMMDVELGDCLPLVEPPEPVALTIENVTNTSFDIYMQNDQPVSGIQIDVSGVVLTGAGGGSAEENGFSVPSSETTILGFSFEGLSIPAGDGLLVTAQFNEATDSDICLTAAVISDTNLPPNEFEVVFGECVPHAEVNDCGDGIYADNCGLCYEGVASSDNNAPDYGPGGLWGFIQSTSQSFVTMDAISVYGENPVSGVNDGTGTGSCPDQNCDIVSLMFNGISVGWSYSILDNEDGTAITLGANLNDFVTPGTDIYPNSGDTVYIEFFDASSETVYTTLNVSTQVANFGYFNVGSITIDDSVNDGCPTEGCMDETACNYDPDALVPGECDYPEEYYDCEGMCINDTDEDDVCDELEIVGCTDDEACNYDDMATDECDDCCEYAEEFFDCEGNCIVEEDCLGVCGGDAEEDCEGVCDGDTEFDECGECGGDSSGCVTFEISNAGIYENADCSGELIYGITGYCLDPMTGSIMEDVFSEEGCADASGLWLPADACYDPWNNFSVVDEDNADECFCGDGGVYDDYYDECVEGSSTGFFWLQGVDFGEEFLEDEGEVDIVLMLDGTFYFEIPEFCEFIFEYPDQEACEDADAYWDEEEDECMVDTEEACDDLGGDWSGGMIGPNEYDVDLETISLVDPGGDPISGTISEEEDETTITISIVEEYDDICFALVFSSDEVNVFGCTDEYDDDYDPEALIDDGSCLLDLAENFIPDMFDLSDNYPNPFNPVTEFKYSVPEVADVNISVFDITGKKVTTLFNGSQKPGVYTVSWNGDGVSTGMYMTVMKAGDKVFTRKMMLIK